MNLNTGVSTNYSLPGPDDITRVELENGLVLLTRSNFNSPSVTISGQLRVGSLFDPDEKLGLADFTASALMRGTQKRSFQQIYDTLESAGASLGLDGGTHTTSFGGKALEEDLDMLLNLLAEVLLTPTFPVIDIERLRAQLLTSLAIRAQDTADMASLAFDKIVYDGHPYSRPEDGYPETIQAITQEDLISFHRRHFGPQGMVIVIVGGVAPDEVVEKVRGALGAWENPEQPIPPKLPPIAPLTQLVRQRVTIPGKSQADLLMGAPGPERNAQTFLAASLGNNVLGQFGLMGRIGDVVREKSGLAYYAHSSLSGGLGPGPWSISAGVDPMNIDKAIDLIRQEVDRFVREPVSDEELADSQANFIGRLPLSLESNSGVASALLNIERYQLGLDYYQTYADQVRAVTTENVLQAAQTYLDADRLGIAVAGP
jgi:zinc protease